MANKNNRKLYAVKQSPIHGKGLFAHCDIKKGAILGKLKCAPTNEDGPYVLWLSEKLSVQVECDLKYINHNSKPNAAYYEDLQVVVLRNIKKGEEITHNYGDEWA